MSKSGADTELEVTLIVVAFLAANPRLEELRGAWRSLEELGGAAEKAIPRKISAH